MASSSGPNRTAGQTKTVLTRRLYSASDDNGSTGTLTTSSREPDELVVEEPLTIQLGSQRVGSTMRTPGHDFELAAGFLLAEGLLDNATVQSIRYCGTASAIESEFNVVSVNTDGPARQIQPRMASISSSCGLCGSAVIDELIERLQSLPNYQPWSYELLSQLPALLAQSQPLHQLTGAAHAAGVYDRAGRLVVLREDIGRHNAVDKVLGHLLLEGALPANDMALVVSGRASFEMVQKAWVGGLTALVAVSAPSALAVEMATKAGMTLVGFARSQSAKLYNPTRPTG